MRPARTLEQYLDAPAGRWLAIGGLTLWSPRPTLGAVTIAAAPDEADAIILERALAHRAGRVSTDMIVDASRLRTVDEALVEGLVRRLTARLGDSQRPPCRYAIVLPTAPFPAAIVAGLPATLGAPAAWRAFDALAPAMAWLDAAAHLAEAEAVLAQIDTVAPAMVALRAFLAAAAGPTTIAAAAHALGRSPRSLQRSLAAAGTTFRREVTARGTSPARRRRRRSDARTRQATGRRSRSRGAPRAAPPARWC